MKIHILGTGCTKCNQLATATQAAADRLGLDFELEKVTEIRRFADFGVMFTPALVVDGQLKATGRVPSGPELEAMLQS